MRKRTLGLCFGLALGTTLAQSAAQAATTTCLFSNPSACTAAFTQGNYTISNVAYSGAFVSPAQTAISGIYFDLIGNKLSANALFIQTSPLIIGETRSGSISFTLSSTDPIYSFTANSTLNPLGGNVTISSPSGPQSITGNIIYNYLPPLAPNTPFTVTYNWSLTGSGAIQSIGTTFNPDPVPGPLPILGGGVAFGFSRRLRRRIQASKAHQA